MENTHKQLKPSDFMNPFGNHPPDERSNREIRNAILTYHAKETFEKIKKGIKYILPATLGVLLSIKSASCYHASSKELSSYLSNPTNITQRIENSGAPFERYSNNYNHSQTMYIIDINNDELADAIMGPAGIEFYTSDYTNSPHAEKCEGALEMNPEIRKASSEYLAKSRTLSKLIYESEHKTRLPR